LDTVYGVSYGRRHCMTQSVSVGGVHGFQGEFDMKANDRMKVFVAAVLLMAGAIAGKGVIVRALRAAPVSRERVVFSTELVFVAPDGVPLTAPESH
jgi:hypothetical protein